MMGVDRVTPRVDPTVHVQLTVFFTVITPVDRVDRNRGKRLLERGEGQAEREHPRGELHREKGCNTVRTVHPTQFWTILDVLEIPETPNPRGLRRGSFRCLARCGGRGAPDCHSIQKFQNRESNSRNPEIPEILELRNRHDSL